MGSRLSRNVSELLDVLVRTTGDPADLTSTLHHIAQTAQTFFTADSCIIFAINPITGRFIPTLTITGNSLKSEMTYEQVGPEELLQQVLEQGILLVEEVEVLPEYRSMFMSLVDIRSFAALAIKMRFNHKPLGALFLGFKQSQQFSSNDQDLFQVFAEQASLLLQETWLLQRYQETWLLQRYQEVVRCGQEINHELATVDLLFQQLQKYVAGIFDTGYILLLAVYLPQSNTLDLYLEEEGRSSLWKNCPLEGVYQYVIDTQQPFFIRQLSKDAERLPFQYSSPLGIESGESLIFVPLVLRGVSLGVLAIQHPLPNAFNQEDVFILQMLANYIALALQDMRLYRSLSQLNETGQLLTLQLESEQTLQMTVDKIRDATQADLVILFPYELTLQRFIYPPRIAGTLLDSTDESMFPSQSDNIVTLTLHQVEPIFASESNSLYAKLQGGIRNQQGNFAQREKVRSAVAVPLQVGDESVGVLFVNFRRPQRFDSPQKLLIEGLAHYAAIAIKNAQTFGTLSQRRMRELEILQNIDRELNRTLTLESVSTTLLRLAHEHVPAEEASILLYNPRMQALEVAAAIGLYAETRRMHIIPLQETKGITRWALEHKKTARVDNVHLDPQWRDLYIEAAASTVSELDVPLLDGQEVVGMLNFESTREAAFRQEDEDFLLTLAGQAVLAIKNAQAHEREKRLAAEAQVLNEISKEIISQLDTDYIFDLILEKALELTHSMRGYLMLYDPDRNDLWMAAERGVAEDKKSLRQGLDQGVAGYVARTKQLLNVDLSQPPWNDVYVPFIPGMHSELAAPMLAGNDLRGVLNVESPSPYNFSESDERLLQGLADLAVIALQNAQAYEREKRLVAEGQVLNQISKEITSQLDLSHVFDLILEKALELTNSHMGNLMLYDPERNDLWMAIERGVIEEKKGQRVGLDQGIMGYVAIHKQLLNVMDVAHPPWNEIFLEYILGTRSVLAIPMLAGDQVRGVLNIESPVPNNFSESDERLLQGLADLAVIALQNAERYEKAEREAQRFELLYQAGEELSKITDLAQLEQSYDVVVQIAEMQSQSQVLIYLYDETNTEVVLKCVSPNRQAPLFERIKLNEGLNGQVARERRTIVVHDTSNVPPGVVSIKQSDPSMHSLVVTPIMFKDRYYGNLALRHEDVGYFRDADILFFEGLAQQLASTIYRLETAQARQELEQRAISAEEMSSIGQSVFEVTHRIGNDLGMIEAYITNIQLEQEKLGVTSAYISRNLERILQAVQTVLAFSGDIKREMAKLGTTEETAGESIVLSPRVLLEDASIVPPLPPNIELSLEIDDDVAPVQVFHSLVADILHNLIVNAIQAMPKGGMITLRSHNAGRYVALEVSDTGVGIPPERLSNIFDLFFSTKGSSGFGLWSARRNALRNQGELKVESKLGQGTTFTLLLPRAN